MINVLLAGVGGQGTVLAAKVLAQAAAARGWQVRTAETIGMAQRGGNVTSHVRMGDGGEEVLSSLITPGTADMVIALEPGEAARALPYLAPGGVLVTATTAIQPVTAALASQPYRAAEVVANLANSLQAQALAEAAKASDAEAVEATGEGAPADAQAPGVEGYPVPLFVPVDDAALERELGPGSRKSLNMMLLAVAVAQNRVPLTLEEVKAAVEACVKPQFVAMNMKAIDHAAQAYG
ncbi:2-oxoacid:acceptor oxidoreductase family protein [uncultured Adlercreutzia sp.]|uniref:2-oxoacid:acceptor oxidoreductase family protein n=1 Tax=uncultured Adlercreutzia sp. TaxID=875803 RepID=UPI0026F3D9C4|nr:2-oxoacid:acceptor oxidoreductase family protein [uncultured Adlercreutzia sp.]